MNINTFVLIVKPRLAETWYPSPARRKMTFFINYYQGELSICNYKYIIPFTDSSVCYTNIIGVIYLKVPNYPIMSTQTPAN